MTWFAIHDGVWVVSLATVVADPLPAHLEAVALVDEFNPRGFPDGLFEPGEGPDRGRAHTVDKSRRP